MRLIDADKLKKHYAWWGSENASDELKERKKDFDDIIDLQPTVEAEPIKHGKWIIHKIPPNDIKYGFICSECDEWSDSHSKFCRKCGAKMDGKEEKK